MSFNKSNNVAYGVQVELTDNMPWWDFVEARPQEGKVVGMREGAVDADDHFLVITGTWKTPEPGEPVFIGPYSAASEPYLTWDALLVAAAEELKLPITGQPAWLFVPDES